MIIRSFTRGFVGSATSFRTAIAVIAVGAYGIVHLAGVTPDQNMNAWDLMLPAATDSTAIGLIGVCWWLSWVIPVVLACTHEHTLVRYGSPVRAVLSTLTLLAGALTAYALLVGVILGAEGARFGFPLQWSRIALHFVDGVPSAFSAAGFARFFPTPIIALASAVLFAAVGMLVAGALVLSVGARGHRRTAIVLAVGLAIWWIVCGFSPIAIPVPIDASLTISLGWALATPGGVVTALAWWTIGVALATVVACRRSIRVLLRSALVARAGILIATCGIAVVAVINAGVRSQAQDVGVAAGFYAGAYGDMISYLLVAIMPAAYATAFLARAADAVDGAVIYQALRRGSYRTWLLVELRRELPWVCGLSVAVGAIVFAGMALQHETQGRALLCLVIGTVGLLAALLFHTALAARIVWTGATLSVAWPLTVGALLAFGYWVPVGIGEFNIIAPYGIPQDFFRPGIPVTATLLTGATAIAVATWAVIRAVPANAEHFA